MVSISSYRVKDNLGYLRKHPRWFCSNPNNFRFVTSSEQLLEKCFPRECNFLTEFDKLGKHKKRMYLKLLGAKKNGFWICQEKTRKNQDLLFSPQSKPSFDESSGTGSDTVKCPICFTVVRVFKNQHIVFCQCCEFPYTNEAILMED